MPGVLSQWGRDAESGVKSAGALDAGDEEAVQEVLVLALKISDAGVEVKIQIGHSRGEQTPHARRAGAPQFDFFGRLFLKEGQGRENILNAIGIVTLVEGEEVAWRPVANGFSCSGL